ncbi:MAG: redoxin domain-containing protein [Candidatus Hydrogenedentes bacterium]|nr:redoxin domain-containing protein [Candidatus Hydrogenedentota bacterium]
MRTKIVLNVFLPTLLIMTLCCHAEEVSPAPTSLIPGNSGAFDDNSKAMLNKLTAYVAQQNTFSFDASVYTKRLYSGKETETCTRYHFVFQRPNLLSMVMELEDERLTVTANGTDIMFCLDSLKRCKTRKQPEDLGALVGWLTQQPVFRRLFSHSLSEGWTDNVIESQCSEEIVDDIPCDRLELDFERTTLVVWFRKGENPIPLRQIADTSETFNAPKGTFSTRIEWENWNTEEEPAPNTFALHIPDDFKEVDRFDRTRESNKGGNKGNAQSLVGEHSPPFVLELLDGTVTSLADHLGKRAIVLEFWATWCRPCKSALLSMAKKAKCFSKDDVVFYAVNLMEPREKVAPFAKKMKLDLPVALDTTGKLADQLRLEAVPSAVFIGKDGSIQAIHVGYSRGLTKKIEGDLRDLAKGKNLAQKVKQPSASKQLRYRLELDSESYCAVFVGY